MEEEDSLAKTSMQGVESGLALDLSGHHALALMMLLAEKVFSGMQVTHGLESGAWWPW